MLRFKNYKNKQAKKKISRFSRNTGKFLSEKNFRNLFTSQEKTKTTNYESRMDYYNLPGLYR